MKTAAIVVLILIGVVLGGLWSIGFFQKIEFEFKEVGHMNTVYMDHKGAYHKIISKIDEVKKYLDENKIAYTAAFGEYLDDPKSVKIDDLRSRGGYIVEKPVKVKPPLMSKTFAKKSYLSAEFQGSPMIGVFMVYPRLAKWLDKNGYVSSGPGIEIYRPGGRKMKTEYLFEVSRKK